MQNALNGLHYEDPAKFCQIRIRTQIPDEPKRAKITTILASNIEEMKKVLKTALDRLETTNLKEEGAGGKKGKRPSALLQRRP